MRTGRWLLWMMIVCFLLACGTASVAQYQNYPLPETVGLNYSLVIGASFLANGNMRNTVEPTVGFSWYGVAGPNFGNSSTIGLSADWTLIQRNDGTDVNVIPLMFNYRQYGVISNYRVFANLGVGLLATTDSIPEMDLVNGANFGWTAGVGLDISNNLFLQGRFIAGNNPGLDGFTTAEIGYRF